jgi:hypothetical protein
MHTEFSFDLTIFPSERNIFPAKNAQNVKILPLDPKPEAAPILKKNLTPCRLVGSKQTFFVWTIFSIGQCLQVMREPEVAAIGKPELTAILNFRTKNLVLSRQLEHFLFEKFFSRTHNSRGTLKPAVAAILKFFGLSSSFGSLFVWKVSL